MNTYIAKTFWGLEEVLEEELKKMGAENTEILNRAVKFQGDKSMLYKSNIYSRTALKILVPLKTFQAKSENVLYREVYQYEWEKLFNLYNTFVIDGVVNSGFFKHSQYASLKTKDAIVDRFRNKYNKRPSVNKKFPDFRINLHISGDQCTLSLDSSGDSLHKRGYKTQNVKAPLNEALAAGLIILSGWDKKSPFIDPMCGSGTLLIEAALLANEIPPGIYREAFGFENWHDFDPTLFRSIKNQFRARPRSKVKIHGCDISEEAIEITRKNLEKSNMSRNVELFPQSVSDYQPPSEKTGTVIINPPYGHKLKEHDIQAFYKKIGNILKKKYTGYDVWIFSNHKQALKCIGLHATNKMTLFNGPLECKFQKYKIYEGSLKNKQT
ncbi:MAG: THUMP domain-containing protein [Bacteroidales bacterium]|nr:methyltransferase domain-containing protein [Bacteroidales bacterium]